MTNQSPIQKIKEVLQTQVPEVHKLNEENKIVLGVIIEGTKQTFFQAGNGDKTSLSLALHNIKKLEKNTMELLKDKVAKDMGLKP